MATSSRLAKFERTKQYLLDMEVGEDVVKQLDRLELHQKEEISRTFSEVVEDEILHVLAIFNKDLFQEYLEQQRRKMIKNNPNIIPISGFKS